MLLLHARQHFPARYSEWFLASILLTIGLLLLRPENIFAQSPAYVGLARIANQTTWGWFCFVFGALRIVALIVNGSWVPSSYHLRAFTAFISCFFWFQFTLGLMATGNPTLMLATAPWLFLSDMVNCHRAASEARLGSAGVGE